MRGIVSTLAYLSFWHFQSLNDNLVEFELHGRIRFDKYPFDELVVLVWRQPLVTIECVTEDIVADFHTIQKPVHVFSGQILADFDRVQCSQIISFIDYKQVDLEKNAVLPGSIRKHGVNLDKPDFFGIFPDA
jgi:hypothetical protein